MTAVLVRGIDVSHFQGLTNWKTKRSSHGLSFGMAKCVESLSFFDSQYTANREGCHLAGMPFIAYAYVRPEAGSALAQARYLVAKAGQVEGLCMDLEISQLSQSATNAWMRAYGDNLRALAPGVTTFAYLGGYAANGSGQSAVDHFDRWIYPHYLMSTWPSLYTPKVGGNTTGWAAPPAPHVWQCSDNIGGTDADVSDLTLPQLFSGADMPLSGADKAFIQDAVRSIMITSLRGNGSIALDDFIAAIDLHSNSAAGALATLTPDEIAAAVVAALPPAQTGGLTQADVVTAVKSVFAQAGATS